MQIDSGLVKKLRMERHWSQSQLADACGLTLRTIQRLESSGRASIESARSLASVFDFNPDDLIVDTAGAGSTPPTEAVRLGFLNYADFSGVASRSEYWWFLGFALLICSAATVVAEIAYQIAGLIFLMPIVSVGSRRLNDAGYSGWWQLLFLVPFGFVVPFLLLARESEVQSGARRTTLNEGEAGDSTHANAS